MSRVEVITGPERRRLWTKEQKRRIFAQAFAPGAMVSEAARRAGVCSGQIYRWRKELHEEAQGFSQVLVAAPTADDRPAAAPIEVDIGGFRVRIGATAPRELVACVIKVLACR
jgi:transposase